MTFYSKIGILELAKNTLNNIILKFNRIKNLYLFIVKLVTNIVIKLRCVGRKDMVEIKNDILVATEQSALLSKAVSDLDNTKEVAKDMQSKLNGNEKAKELIEKSFDISKAVSQVMKTMSNNLLTTSQSFQEKDEQIEKQMENLLIRNVEGFTLNGPVKQ